MTIEQPQGPKTELERVPQPTRRQLTATRRVVIAFAAVTFLSLAVGFGAAWIIKSPGQLASEQAPPPPSVITATVEEGTVTQSVVFTGAVALGNRVEFAAPAVSTPVVTRTPLQVGSDATAGTVLVEIADRPLILLDGEIPLLRDLHRGDKGPDVTRLQGSLEAYGAPIDGVFGRSTEQALRSLYEQAGYAPPTDGPGRASALQAELVFAPNAASGRVVAQAATVGKTAPSPLIALTTAPAVVDAQLSQVEADRLEVGATGAISGQGLETAVEGTITDIGTLTKTADGAFRVPVRLAINEVLPSALIDSAVQVTIDTADSAELGLIVPLSAIHARSDGTTFVVVVTRDDEVEVEIQVVETGDGVARIAVGDDAIKAGDEVKVGGS